MVVSRFEESSRISGGGFRVSRNFSNPGKSLKPNFPYRGKVRHRRRTSGGRPCEPCAPCHHPTLHKIDQGHIQGPSQAVSGRRKRRAQRELYSSSRHSRLTDIAKINTKSPPIFMSWRACLRQKLSSRGTVRHGHLSRSQGTFSGSTQRTA